MSWTDIAIMLVAYGLSFFWVWANRLDRKELERQVTFLQTVVNLYACGNPIAAKAMLEKEALRFREERSRMTSRPPGVEP